MRPLPDVRLRAQDGSELRLREDLLTGRIALINFFYTHCAAVCPATTANLAKVAEGFGDRLGRDVVMLSVTVDPANDTPAALKAYAAQYHTKTGWYFLTGRRDDLETLRDSLGLRDRDNPQKTHTSLLVYGSADAEQWAAVPALLPPQAIVRSVMRLVDLARVRSGVSHS